MIKSNGRKTAKEGMTMATCFNCGVQLPDGAAFCGECGTAQNMQAPQQNVQPQQPGVTLVFGNEYEGLL